MAKHNQHHSKPHRRRSGFSMIEILISVVIIVVLATGAMGYQYNSTRDVKISEVQAGACRIAMLLLEGWKGNQGQSDFDPVDVFGDRIAIEISEIGPDAPNNSQNIPMTPLGSYRILAGGICYFVTLSYETESAAEPLLLNASVSWRKDYMQDALTGDEQTVRYSTFYSSW